MEKGKALFITFEGGEGAGKTTLIDRLAKQFPSVLQTREPGGTLLSEKIRALLLENHNAPISSQAELLLFLAARAQHLQEKIIPALREGTTVLCDRFNESTIVYQGIARGLGKKYVQDLCNLSCGNPSADLTFYLDVPPEIGLKRASDRDTETDRIGSETLAFHNRVREGFLLLAKENPRIKVIDATQSADHVYKQVLKELS